MARRELQVKSGDLGALNANFDMDVTEHEETVVTIFGTFVGTVSFLVSDNGTDFFPAAGVAADNTARTTGVISTTAGGKAWAIRTRPFKVLRCRMTAYTSGTANCRASGYTR